MDRVGWLLSIVAALVLLKVVLAITRWTLKLALVLLLVAAAYGYYRLVQH